MKPRIDATEFGSITVEGAVFDHDVVISPDGDVSKRKKKLSKAVYVTSHTISLQEAKIRLPAGSGDGPPDRRRRAVRQGAAIARGGRLPRPKSVRDRPAAHPSGDRDLERDRGQGCRAVSCHVLSSPLDRTALTTPWRPGSRAPATQRYIGSMRRVSQGPATGRAPSFWLEPREQEPT